MKKGKRNPSKKKRVKALMKKACKLKEKRATIRDKMLLLFELEKEIGENNFEGNKNEKTIT